MASRRTYVSLTRTLKIKIGHRSKPGMADGRMGRMGTFRFVGGASSAGACVLPFFFFFFFGF